MHFPGLLQGGGNQVSLLVSVERFWFIHAVGLSCGSMLQHYSPYHCPGGGKFALASSITRTQSSLLRAWNFRDPLLGYAPINVPFAV